MYQGNEEVISANENEVGMQIEAPKIANEQDMLLNIDFDNVEDILDFSVQPASKSVNSKSPKRPPKLLKVIAEDPVKLLELQPIISKFVADEGQNSEVDGKTKVRRFKCIFCEKKFIRSTHLNRHLRIHTGDKPYFCPICRQRFSRVDYMKAHVSSHQQDKVHRCCVCRKVYDDLATFTDHCLSHDDSEYVRVAMNNTSIRHEFPSKKQVLIAEASIPVETCIKQLELISYVMIEKVDNSFEKECVACVENPMYLPHQRSTSINATSFNNAGAVTL